MHVWCSWCVLRRIIHTIDWVRLISLIVKVMLADIMILTFPPAHSWNCCHLLAHVACWVNLPGYFGVASSGRDSLFQFQIFFLLFLFFSVNVLCSICLCDTWSHIELKLCLFLVPAHKILKYNTLSGRHGWWTAAELPRRSRVHLVRVIMRVLYGKAIQPEHARIANILLTIVMYGSLAFLLYLSGASESVITVNQDFFFFLLRFITKNMTVIWKLFD